MKKYFQVFRLTLQEYFVYRLNFILWRLRSFLFFLTLIFFWLAVYGKTENMFGYQKSQMLTYVVGVAFLRGIVLASRVAELAHLIRDGELSKLLLVPVNIFKVFLSWDLSDKFLNITFSILEIVLVFFLFHFSVFIPSLGLILLSLLAVILAFFLYFFLNMSLSVTAFWTDDIWSTRWLFGVIILEFFSGAIFPIDVLPLWLSKIVYLTPFPYLVFFPIKIWLGQVSLLETVRILAICFTWLVFFYFLSHFLWKKGIKTYTAHRG